MCNPEDARVQSRIEAMIIAQADDIMAQEDIRDPRRRFAILASALAAVHDAALQSIPPVPEVIDLRGLIRGGH